MANLVPTLNKINEGSTINKEKAKINKEKEKKAVRNAIKNKEVLISQKQKAYNAAKKKYETAWEKIHNGYSNSLSDYRMSNLRAEKDRNEIKIEGKSDRKTKEEIEKEKKNTEK